MDMANIINFFDSSLFRFFRSKTLAEQAEMMSPEEIYQWWILSVFNEWSKISVAKNQSLNTSTILPLVAFFEGYRTKAMMLIDDYLSTLETFKEKRVAIH